MSVEDGELVGKDFLRGTGVVVGFVVADALGLSVGASRATERDETAYLHLPDTALVTPLNR